MLAKLFTPIGRQSLVPNSTEHNLFYDSHAWTAGH